jgi:geranylgeranyl pyrophosphate synthase
MEPATATFLDRVRLELPEVEARMRASPGSHHPSLEAALGQILSAGGKRIRPAVVLLAGRMLGGKPDRLITMAASVELLHTATLVHDDLIDGSLLRRGLPTLNASWSPGATVLTGDYVFARAAHLAAQSGSLVLMDMFARTLMTIVNGELTQLFGSHSEDLRQDYYDRIYAKTASLFELSAEGAAVLSGSDEETVRRMKAYGYHIGMAFQIVDDVLDFVADPRQVGKPVASDLRHGLLTLPTLLHLETRPENGDLAELLRNRSLDEDGLMEHVEEIRSSGAIERAMEEAREMAATGVSQLEDFPGSPDVDALRELAHYLVERGS